MKKTLRTICASLALSAVCATPAAAQITTGEPVAHTITTGNRPTAGTYGFFLGASADLFITKEDLFKDDIINVSPLPVFNFKYMQTDELEFRVGLEAQRRTERISGETAEDNTAYSIRYSEHSFSLRPGIALHFSPQNVLDVYAGGEVILGRTGVTRRIQDNNIRANRSSFDMGAGAFIGFQAFVGDLPLALGFEAELLFKYQIGLQQKIKTAGTETIIVNADNFPLINEMYPAAFGESWSSLSASKGSIGSQLRLTISYYFNR